MSPEPTRVANTQAPAIALISIAALGLLLILLAALAPAYPGLFSDTLPTIVLLGIGALMLGLSIFGAALLVVSSLKRQGG